MVLAIVASMSVPDIGSPPPTTATFGPHEFAVIRDARRRQRRRRLAVTIAALAAGVVAYVAVRTATGGIGQLADRRSSEWGVPGTDGRVLTAALDGSRVRGAQLGGL
jgi:hypothetical protein